MTRFLARRAGALTEALLLLTTSALVIAVVSYVAGIPLMGMVRGGTSVISGLAWEDLDHDGFKDEAEAPLGGQKIYLAAANGDYLRYALTDGEGRYEFDRLAEDAYLVKYSPPSWWALRDAWVPTTTGTPYPKVQVQLDGSASADFGWRPIVRSTDLARPISVYTGGNGLQIQVYNDVVAAEEVYAHITEGLTGPEAASTTIRLGYGTSNSTATSVGRVDGEYVNYAAVAYVSYVAWLDGEWTLSHEYGHAWSLYYGYLVQQDPSLAGYLAARGIAGDERLGSSYAWLPRELIADDYRQLLGPEAARAAPPLNMDLPPAASVPGLGEYLAVAFTGGSAAAVAGTPQPSSSAEPVTPTPAASAIPTPVASGSPTTLAGSASPSPSPPAPTVAELSVEPRPVKTSAEVRYTLSAAAVVSVAIHDRQGKLIRELLVSSARPAGASLLAWDRRDSRGRRVRGGDYVVLVTATAGGISEAASLSFEVQ